jgi:hypothetical protein
MQPWIIESYYGESHLYRITFVDSAGAPLDVSDNLFHGRVKSVRGVEEFNLIVDNTISSHGIVFIALPTLPVGSYMFDVIMSDTYGQNKVVANGTIRINKGVTL